MTGTSQIAVPAGYHELLEEISSRISTSQVRAALGVSRELVLLYWSIGREILGRQGSEGWGAKVIDRLGRDLQARFPGVEGFSPRNLKYMRSLAQAWPDPTMVPQCVALLPWGHLRLLLDRVKEPETRQWYLQAALEYGWSRDVLAHMVTSRLHERQGKALTNFAAVVPPSDSDMAVQVLRDPYNFDFLTLSHPVQERELERGLLLHLRDLLLELGRGFAFVGSQVSLPVGDQTFYLDLLFYHVRLHCYFVIELKTGEFKPEYAGKLNFYLAAVDGIMKTGRDEPTIGLLLCESQDEAVVEFSFKNLQSPIGVSTYTVTRELPTALEEEVPSVQDLKRVVEKLRGELEAARKAELADPREGK
jgi:predicted nuclease of restriction endonuclease-like (RecB) superfamily